MFPVLQGSADTLVWRDGKLYRLSIAYFLRNTPARNYYNPTVHNRVTAKNVGDPFYETQCILSVVVIIISNYTFTRIQWSDSVVVQIRLLISKSYTTAMFY